MFSNLNGFLLLLTPPQSNKIGQCSEIGLGRRIYIALDTRSSQSLENKKRSNQAFKEPPSPPHQVYAPLPSGGSTSSNSSIKPENSLIVVYICLPFLVSPENCTTLKSPTIYQGSFQSPLTAASSSHNSLLSLPLSGPYNPKNTQTNPSQFL